MHMYISFFFFLMEIHVYIFVVYLRIEELIFHIISTNTEKSFSQYFHIRNQTQ